MTLESRDPVRAPPALGESAMSDSGAGARRSDPALNFLVQHVRGNKMLTEEKGVFMGRLCLLGGELPWGAREAVKCVFENSGGEVEVCFEKRHLFFSPDRQEFIAKNINSQEWASEETALAREWVNAQRTGPWSKSLRDLDREPAECGFINLEILGSTQSGGLRLKVLQVFSRDQGYDALEDPQPGGGIYPLRHGMGDIKAQSRAELALAHGAKGVILVIPTCDSLKYQSWVDRVRKHFPSATVIERTPEEFHRSGRPENLPVFSLPTRAQWLLEMSDEGINYWG